MANDLFNRPDPLAIILTRSNVGRYVRDEDLIASLVPYVKTRTGDLISIKEHLKKGRLRIMVDCINRAMLDLVNQAYEQWDPEDYSRTGPLNPGSKHEFSKAFAKLVWAQVHLPSVEVRFTRDPPPFQGQPPGRVSNMLMGFPTSHWMMREPARNLESGGPANVVHPVSTTGVTLNTGSSSLALQGKTKKPRISNVGDQSSTSFYQASFALGSTTPGADHELGSSYLPVWCRQFPDEANRTARNGRMLGTPVPVASEQGSSAEEPCLAKLGPIVARTDFALQSAKKSLQEADERLKEAQQLVLTSADCGEERAKLERVNKNLASEVGILMQRVTELDEAYRKKQDEVKVARDLNDRLIEEIRRLNTEMDELPLRRAEREEPEVDNASADERALLLERNSNLECEVQTLRQKVAELEQSHASKQQELESTRDLNSKLLKDTLDQLIKSVTGNTQALERDKEAEQQTEKKEEIDPLPVEPQRELLVDEL